MSAPAFVSLFGFPADLHEQAVDLVRIVALALPLGLTVAAVSNALQGFERFTAIAVTAAIGSVAYLAALVILIGQDASLSQLAWAVIAQQLVVLLARAGLALDVLVTRPSFVSRGTAREMAASIGA